MEKITPKFSCSQKDLVSVAQTAWRNFLMFVIAFGTHKKKYQESTATEALAALKIANDMPDVKQRERDAEDARIDMAKMADGLLGFYIILKTYIDDAYEEDKRELNYEAAGLQYYRDAQQKDWESVAMLGSRMNTFIEKNETVLLADDNMSETFKKEVADAVDSYDKKFDDYKVFSETSIVQQEKIKALNKCFDTVTAMMKDGKAIFRKDAAKTELFTFSAILASINSAKAGITGTVTDKVTDEVIKKVTMTVKYPNEPVIKVEVDEDGSFNSEMKSGKPVITIAAEGYIPVSEEATINAGSTFRLNVKLERAA